MGFFDNLLAPFNTDSQEKAAADQIAAINRGRTEGQGYLGQGRSDIQGSFAEGLAPLTQTYGQAQGGAQNYGDATGVNGPAGNARAVSNFQTGPGYDFLMKQGIQNVDRNRAATGALNSGGTDTAVANYATGLADQTWQKYIQNLLPFLGQQGQAAGQIGALGANKAAQLAGNSGASANLAYGSNVAQGNAQASADLAPLSAGANMWGLATNIGKLATGSGIFDGLGGGPTQASMGGGYGGDRFA